MRIKKIYTDKLGPVSNSVSPIDLRDSWKNEIYSSVLFSGPNGCGKTMLLNSIAFLWDAFSYWLNYKTTVPPDSEAGKWFRQWGGFAVIIDEIPVFQKPAKEDSPAEESPGICLFFGDRQWIKKIKEENKDVRYWNGEIQATLSASSGLATVLGSETTGQEKELFNNWEKGYKRLILGEKEAGTPNIIYLDSEERQWVKPTRHIGELIPDDITKRWLFKYQVTGDWKGQLENSLVNYKITAKQKEFKKVIDTLNAFFTDKKISADIRTEDRNRFRILLKKPKGAYHYFDWLSSGERQLLVMLFNVLRWMEPGGIVMIDEPDLFLHPSLVTRFLSTLEDIVEKKHGQLIITSHNKDVWNRYENLGKRITLGEPL